MAQSRNSAFFTDFAIPDTVIGRTDMLALHVFLINYRLKGRDGDGAQKCVEVSQKVFDLFVNDLERGLRELGFADTSVHKRKKKLVHSYYALIDEFDQVLVDHDREPLAAAVEARYFTHVELAKRAEAAGKLTAYILRAAQNLEAIDIATCLKGDISWPAISEEKP